LMISFSHISKQYGRQVLFVDASFQLNPGEKVGLVGPNGSGKTTLFRLIVGEDAPDEGDVSVPKKITIGYFRQDVEEMSGRSVLDEAIAGSGRVGDLHHELESLQHQMADPSRADEMDKILARFGEVQEEYDHFGGYALESQAREVLLGLGFDEERIDGDVGALSGGWKMRVAMARVLLGQPDVLLMDEPTNHLDIESIVWLERFLKSRTGALLMTSHDRDFMNRIVGKIAEIDDVSKAYGRRIVHDGLNLTIRRGERWCAMGKNGAGKSTLLKMVAGELMPDRGSIRMGASVKMGYFAQQSLDLLDPALTID